MGVLVMCIWLSFVVDALILGFGESGMSIGIAAIFMCFVSGMADYLEEEN